MIKLIKSIIEYFKLKKENRELEKEKLLEEYHQAADKIQFRGTGI